MSEYQLPRLTRMWSHLERQGGGRSKGMGEKQIEVDKRILRNRMALLRKELEEVCHAPSASALGGEEPVLLKYLIPQPSFSGSTLRRLLGG